MQSEAGGEVEAWARIEPVSISMEKNDHYIHYDLSESTYPGPYDQYNLRVAAQQQSTMRDDQ